MDKDSVDTLLNYNYNLSSASTPNFSNEHTSLLQKKTNVDLNPLGSMTNLLSPNSLNVSLTTENPTIQNSQNSATDVKGHSNSLKYLSLTKADNFNSVNQELDLQAVSTSSLPHSQEDSSPRTFKFKDLKSPNLGFLSSEKNVRLTNEVNPSNFNASMLNGVNNLDDIVSYSIDESITPNSASIYESSKND
jgi:hypothetical protein